MVAERFVIILKDLEINVISKVTMQIWVTKNRNEKYIHRNPKVSFLNRKVDTIPKKYLLMLNFDGQHSLSDLILLLAGNN